MTNTPGDDQPPQYPYGEQPEQPEQPEQQAAPQPPAPGYGQPQYGQPGQAPYGQPQYGQPQYGQPQYGQPQYGQPGYPYAPAPPDHPRATTAMILGIVGLVVCAGLTSPFAWVIGKRAMNDIDAAPGTMGGRGQAQAGYILGIIGTVYLGAMVLIFGGLIVAAVIGAATTASSGY